MKHSFTKYPSNYVTASNNINSIDEAEEIITNLEQRVEDLENTVRHQKETIEKLKLSQGRWYDHDWYCAR